jgi:hypothetical protein
MSVFERITTEIPLGMEMYTPVRKKPFRINRKEDEIIDLSLYYVLAFFVGFVCFYDCFFR